MADGSVVKAADASLAFEPVATVTRDVVSDGFDFSGVTMAPGQVSAMIEQVMPAFTDATLLEPTTPIDPAALFDEHATLQDPDAFRF
jgi:hypothetical protein